MLYNNNYLNFAKNTFNLMQSIFHNKICYLSKKKINILIFKKKNYIKLNKTQNLIIRYNKLKKYNNGDRK